MPKSRIALAIFVAILAVSTASIFIRFAQEDAPSLVIAAARLTLASLALAPFALFKHRDEIRSLTRREWILAICSGVFLSIHFASWITSLEYTTVVSSVVLVSTGPLWVALLSPIFLKETPSRWVWIGMTLALIGGLIVGLGDSCTLGLDTLPAVTTRPAFSLACPPLSDLLAGSAFWGNFLALLGAWTVAGYLMIGRNLRAKISLVPYIFIVYGVAAIALLVCVAVAKQSLLGYPQLTYLWLICLALIPQLIGHSTYNWALRYMPASLVSITTLGEPIGSAILAFFLLSETPSLLTLLGGGFILAGIYLSTKTSR
ncbi:MAG: EamA/RhaT family transporter [Anaerolineaceae bacterium]|nr:MAG: EamA/RhaT family transporter [Anaerolineaceae bacterium]